MFYASENLDLPQLPMQFVRSSLKTFFTVHKNDTHYYSGPGEFKIKLMPELYQWVNDNICNDFSGAGVQTIESGNFDPHIDGPGRNQSERYLTLLYVIESGGNPYTRFYKTSSDLLAQSNTETRHFDVNELELVKECQFKQNTWNLLNNRVIHSVSGIKSTRVCFCINFLTPEPQSMQRYF